MENYQISDFLSSIYYVCNPSRIHIELQEVYTSVKSRLNLRRRETLHKIQPWKLICLTPKFNIKGFESFISYLGSNSNIYKNVRRIGIITLEDCISNTRPTTTVLATHQIFNHNIYISAADPNDSSKQLTYTSLGYNEFLIRNIKCTKVLIGTDYETEFKKYKNSDPIDLPF